MSRIETHGTPAKAANRTPYRRTPSSGPAPGRRRTLKPAFGSRILVGMVGGIIFGYSVGQPTIGLIGGVALGTLVALVLA